MNPETRIIGIAVIWLIGTILGLLGSSRIRDYKDYDQPYLILIIGIFCAVTMSWAFVMLTMWNREFELPLWLYHDCAGHASITYEEEYVKDDDGNIVEHHTFRVWKCKVCGKTWKDQLQ